MTCLVTGGHGFLGSRLITRLVAARHKVVVLDPQTPGAEAIDAGVENIQSGISDEDAVRYCLDKADIVFHFAGSALPNASNLNPELDISETLRPTIRFVRLVSEHRVRKLIFASSGGTVYGLPTAIPLAETHGTNPISSYGIVKLTTEKYLALFRRMHGLSFVALRYSNPFGEGQNPFAQFGAVASFLGALKRGREISIWGNGNAIRDFIYVEDAITATLAAVEYEGPESIFNIGSGQGTSIADLLELTQKITGIKARVRYLPPREGDVPAVVLDVSLARRELGWTPQTNLEGGIRTTWAWCRELRDPGDT